MKFLRVLERGEFYRVGGTKLNRIDLRVIAASNTPLDVAMEEGRFRRDLYYRLYVAHIELPPLRDRKADIVQLAKLFLDRFNQKLGRQINGFTKTAEEALTAYSWPGNVRELRNVIERVALLSDNSVIDNPDLALANLSGEKANGMVINLSLDLNETNNAIREANYQLIQKILEITAGNKTRAARLLGIPRGTLRYHLSRDSQP